jgi:hypothetical protein
MFGTHSKLIRQPVWIEQSRARIWKPANIGQIPCLAVQHALHGHLCMSQDQLDTFSAD